uniref:Uncharacterized protein n=1 Tax=Anguilla anguilla TaxID=7936 RepID=A0A0E9X8G5_ANGAN
MDLMLNTFDTCWTGQTRVEIREKGVWGWWVAVAGAFPTEAISSSREKLSVSQRYIVRHRPPPPFLTWHTS